MDPDRMNARLSLLLCICVLTVEHVYGSGACFEFTGDGHVSFSPENVDISSKAHFKLSFKTLSDTGIIYYAEGTYQRERVYDYEGLFLRNGYLHYFLFNPAEYSIGSSFGFYGRSKMRLNDGMWHTVEFYRNMEESIKDRYGGTREVEQTGLTVDGVQQAVDYRPRAGVHIFKPIILGGDPHEKERGENTAIGGFRGKIKDFQDVIRNYPFNQPDPMKKIVPHCLSEPDPA